MPLDHLPIDALPREKLLARGATSLSDAELLAILLRTGTVGKNVLLMAQEVLDTCGGLAGLLSANAAQLKAIKGLGGSAKRAELLAVMELARRAMTQQLQQQPCLDNPALAAQYAQMHLAHMPHECFAVLFLDVRHHLIGMETLFTGTIDQTSVYPREIAIRALHHRAAGVILAHNHPSGHTEPSAADIALTKQLHQALGLLDIAVLDHLVVAQGQTTSLAQRGLMPASATNTLGSQGAQ